MIATSGAETGESAAPARASPRTDAVVSGAVESFIEFVSSLDSLNDGT
jgi:hypothetical protein